MRMSMTGSSLADSQPVAGCGRRAMAAHMLDRKQLDCSSPDRLANHRLEGCTAESIESTVADRSV